MQHQSIELTFPPTVLDRNPSQAAVARLVVALEDAQEYFDEQNWIDCMIDDLNDNVDRMCSTIGIQRPSVEFDVEFARAIDADGVDGDTVAELWSDADGEEQIDDVEKGCSPDLKIMAALLLRALEISTCRQDIVETYEADRIHGLNAPMPGGRF